MLKNLINFKFEYILQCILIITNLGLSCVCQKTNENQSNLALAKQNWFCSVRFNEPTKVCTDNKIFTILCFQCRCYRLWSCNNYIYHCLDCIQDLGTNIIIYLQNPFFFNFFFKLFGNEQIQSNYVWKHISYG